MRWPSALMCALGFFGMLSDVTSASVASTSGDVPPWEPHADSNAPANAPAHWIPMGEPWVVNHWLPFDEERLFRLLRAPRAEIWRWLRDDHRSIDAFARRRGHSVVALTDALVAPRRSSVSPGQLAVLRARTLRVLTQGHLAQHIIFHSLHQTAIPNASPQLFGVRAKAAWDRLRIEEMSPVRIARLHGRTRAQVQSDCVALLRGLASAGVRRRETSQRQADLLLARQLRQLPRWLQQDRNNGPPLTGADGKPVAKARYYASHPAISADGTLVAFESYEPDNRVAASYGEIRIDGWRAGADEPTTLTRPGRNGPWSSFSPALSGDGRQLAFETSAGNRNFGKRYGGIDVRVVDVASGRSVRVPNPFGRTASEYRPSLSTDGRLVAYEAQEGVERGGRPSYAVRASVYDRATRRTITVRRSAPGLPDGGVWESRLSADGRFLVFISAYPTRGASRPSRTRAQVYRYELATGQTTLVSRAAGRTGPRGDGESSEPQISADGRFVAFTSTATKLTSATSVRRARVYVRDIDAGTTERVSPRGTFAWQPAISADGRRIAYVAAHRARASGESSVWVYDASTGERREVSRTAEGRPRHAFAPALSADGRHVTFVAAAPARSAQRGRAPTSVFVRDLGDDRLTLVSTAGGGARDRPPGPGRHDHASR